MRRGAAIVCAGCTGRDKLQGICVGVRTSSASADTPRPAADQRENHNHGKDRKRDEDSSPVTFLPVTGQDHAEQAETPEAGQQIRTGLMRVQVRAPCHRSTCDSGADCQRCLSLARGYRRSVTADSRGKVCRAGDGYCPVVAIRRRQRDDVICGGAGIDGAFALSEQQDDQAGAIRTGRRCLRTDSAGSAVAAAHR